MWGNFFAESTYLQNFTFGFPNKQSDILLHLTHWQYWFWFWFTYFLVMYYFIFLRLIRFRSQKFSPKLATTFRSHGKWGDLLVCFVPLSWCTNILSNSNFILRMIEWQSESSLFTLRIRGKQWYWVYKFELKTLLNITDANKNVGRNNFIQNISETNNNLFFVKFKHDLMYNYLAWNNVIPSNIRNQVSVSNFNKSSIKNNVVTTNLLQLNSTLNQDIDLMANNQYMVSKSLPFKKNLLNTDKNVLKTLNLTELSNVNDSFSVNSRTTQKISRIDKLSTNFTNIRLLSGKDFKLNLNFKQSFFTKKPVVNNLFLVIKQKRFSTPNFSSSRQTFSNISLDYFKKNLKKFNEYYNNNFNITDMKSAANTKRLLRTRRVLILPTKTNITLITNSFDVMHSWYIPGLGVKLDCVPGRSTHHVIHISHTGFYYGQCAEICGRYHHHMPIRVCALPFDHFLVWWWHYGSPFFLNNGGDRDSFKKVSSSYFNW